MFSLLSLPTGSPTSLPGGFVCEGLPRARTAQLFYSEPKVVTEIKPALLMQEQEPKAIFNTPPKKHEPQMAGWEGREDSRGGDLEETGPTVPWGDPRPGLPAWQCGVSGAVRRRGPYRKQAQAQVARPCRATAKEGLCRGEEGRLHTCGLRSPGKFQIGLRWTWENPRAWYGRMCTGS